MQQALPGVRVLELGDFVSAPWAARLLGDLGAEVVKVEPPGGGDRSRQAGPFPGDEPDPESSGLFLYLNANKQGITLDLSVPAARSTVFDLARTADVVIENLPVAVVDKHELDTSGRGRQVRVGQ
jgi:crotonobetainyl-CoA:carnitine CoA-transferase CaiB-like acyl-CoA transferase